MPRLGRIARWWWRWMLLWTVLAGLGLVVLLVLPLTSLLPDPQIRMVAPIDGTTDVGLQQPLHFTFSTPMDSTSVAQAFTISPPLDGSWLWIDARTAQWQPIHGWNPSATYTIHVSTTARSKARQALPAPFEARFSTVIAPTVERVWPTPGGRLLQPLPLVLHFDQAMQAVHEPIRLVPPTAYQATWSDPQTVVLDVTWQPGRSYSVTLNPILDLNDIPAQPQSWMFDLALPAIVSVQPATTTLLQQSQPLSWTFDGVLEPLTVQGLTSTMQIEPSTGAWRVQYLATGRTEIGWHPTQPWSGSVSATLPTPTPNQWRWSVARPLGVVATIPGRDGIVVSDQEIRLVLSAEPDPTLIRSTLAITPNVTNLDVVVVGTEATVEGDFSPNQAYTLTLPSVTPPLTLPFRVAAAQQVLQFADQRPFRLWEAGATPQIEIYADDLSTTTATLYPVDRGLLLTILRAENTLFEPRRFGLEPLQTWTFSATTRTTLQVPDLASGSYILQVQGPNRQRIQQVLVLTPFTAQLTTSTNGASAIVVDARNGTPIANLPLTLLSGGSQIAEGVTDGAGLWQTALPFGVQPDLLIGSDSNALVVATPILELAAPSNPLTATILPLSADRRQILVVGHSRAQHLVNLKVLSAEDERLTNIQVPVTADGVFSTTVRVSNEANLRIVLDDQVTLAIPDPVVHHPQLAIHTAQTINPSQTFSATFVTYQNNGLGLPAQQVEWRLIDEQGAQISEGTLQTNSVGSATINVGLPVPRPQSITLIANSGAAVVRQPVTIQPAYRLSLTAAQQLLAPRDSVALTLTVVDERDLPVAGLPVTITVAPEATTLRGTTNSTGQTVLTWRIPRNGAFSAQASGGGNTSAPLPLWATTNGYRGWEDGGLPTLPLAVERFTIVAGQPIRVLPLLQAAQGRAYLSWYDGATLITQMLNWTAGEPLSFTLPPTTLGEHTLGLSVVTVENQRSIIRSTQFNITQQPAFPLAIQTIADATLLHGASDSNPASLLISEQQPNGTLWERSVVRVPLVIIEATMPATVLAWNATSATASTLAAAPSPQQPVIALPTTLQQGDHITIAASTSAAITTSSGLSVTNPLQQGAITHWTLQGLEAGTQHLTWTLDPAPITHTLTVADPLAPQQSITSRVITRTTTISNIEKLIILPSLDHLEQRSYAELAANPDLLAVAGRIAIAQSGGPLDSLSQDIAILQNTRGDHNGWSWNGTATDPLYTAMVVRLLATGTPTPDVQALIDRAERYLAQTTPNDPALEAALIAVQAKLGHNVQAEIERLLNGRTIDTDSQLLLIQALLDLRLERRATSALNAFLASEPTPLQQPWASCGWRSAMEGQILLELNPQNPRLPIVLEQLGTCWQGTGWGDPIATTEAVLLLQRIPQETLRAQSYRVEQHGTLIYQGSRPFHSTSMASEWTIIPNGPLVVTSSTSITPAQPTISVLGHIEALNPLTTTIRPGDHLLLEWIVLVERPIEYVDLTIPLPTGLSLEAITTSGFTMKDRHGRIQRLEAGIYTIHAVVQPTFAGTFIWPMPKVTSAGKPVPMAAQLPALAVTPQTP